MVPPLLLLQRLLHLTHLIELRVEVRSLSKSRVGDLFKPHPAHVPLQAATHHPERVDWLSHLLPGLGTLSTNHDGIGCVPHRDLVEWVLLILDDKVGVNSP